MARSECFEPAGQARVEIEIRKSRFVGTLRKVLSAKEAREAVKEEKSLHPGARHVVFAFLVGPPASETAGLGDDGEPKGTAGRPVMEVLRGSGLRNALVTVSRYFGGVKLGTGGLARAYSACCKNVLELAPRVPLRAEKRRKISVPFGFLESVRRELSRQGCRIEEENFAEEATLAFFAGEDGEGLMDTLRDITRGKMTVWP
ncbi:MAG: IMPACT family protein [Spirochaetia bacterium]|nr:IMPACT family protein [Spirochaetia bacterium]